MGTRCGALDPGVVLYLMQELGMDVAAVQRLMYQESGLLGVSGISSDMRTLEQSDDPRAKAAIALMVYRIGRELGRWRRRWAAGCAGVLRRHRREQRRLRAAVCRDAAWLGVRLDAAPMPQRRGVRRISAADSKVAVWVVPANEELMIAQHALQLVEAP
jgi:acetate kinase